MFAALARAIVWLKKDAMAILRSYGIATPPDFFWGVDKGREVSSFPQQQPIFTRGKQTLKSSLLLEAA